MPLVRRFLFLSTLVLALLNASGCAMFHGWAGLGSRQPFAAGGSISVPLGK